MNIALSGMDSMHLLAVLYSVADAECCSVCNRWLPITALLIFLCLHLLLYYPDDFSFLKNLYSVDDFRHVNVILMWSI